jgi:hypothetical protein
MASTNVPSKSDLDCLVTETEDSRFDGFDPKVCLTVFFKTILIRIHSCCSKFKQNSPQYILYEGNTLAYLASMRG